MLTQIKLHAKEIIPIFVFRNTYSNFLTRSCEIKSFAVSEISSKASSSKSHMVMVTFDSVSASVSPINGDSPDNLTMYIQLDNFALHWYIGQFLTINTEEIIPCDTYLLMWTYKIFI